VEPPTIGDATARFFLVAAADAATIVEADADELRAGIPIGAAAVGCLTDSEWTRVAVLYHEHTTTPDISKSQTPHCKTRTNLHEASRLERSTLGFDSPDTGWCLSQAIGGWMCCRRRQWYNAAGYLPCTATRGGAIQHEVSACGKKTCM
jgi:hypothetical protein